MTDAPHLGAYAHHILLCNGDSAELVAQHLATHLGALLQVADLTQGEQRVIYSVTDSLGDISGGPILVIYPDGLWYHHVDAELLARIVDEYLLGGQLVTTRLFHHAASNSAQVRASTAPAPKRNMRKPHGLLIVNTGDGKGKTTAALGIVLRAWGRDMRIGGIQFFKHANANFGELRALTRIGIDLRPMGDGFTWTSRDIEETQAKALHGWERAKQEIASGEYDIFLLDEFTYLLHFGWLDTTIVIDWIAANKPSSLHMIITGRDAPAELIAFADLVTDMREVKHPLRDQGLRAQPGIEF